MVRKNKDESRHNPIQKSPKYCGATFMSQKLRDKSRTTTSILLYFYPVVGANPRVRPIHSGQTPGSAPTIQNDKSNFSEGSVSFIIL